MVAPRRQLRPLLRRQHTNAPRRLSDPEASHGNVS